MLILKLGSGLTSGTGRSELDILHPYPSIVNPHFPSSGNCAPIASNETTPPQWGRTGALALELFHSRWPVDPAALHLCLRFQIS